ncbi:DUF1294 domain-containing protein [Glaesserella sp.]|uniref:DUF1294 domain-containing protein n=1 Tax=Glaesserella sp. TaxID=2094731 RepID=UPI0035A0CC73
MVLYFVIYLIGINALSAYMMYSDKQKSKKKAWRVPESNLFFLCVSGGFLGTYLIMKHFKHKTKHWQFHFAVIVSAFVWLLCIPGFYWYLQV